MRARLFCVLFAVFAFLGVSCREVPVWQDDLAMARSAFLERDWSLSERLLGRYLREEQNPQKRWEAWNLLLQAINANSSEPRASLECLEAMLAEFDDDENKQADILSRIAAYNESLRRYDRAASAWNSYIDLGNLDNAARLNGLRNLAAMQINQRHFEAAEDTLQQCLSLPVSEHDKIFCMLDLASANMMNDQWQAVADLCQQIMDADPDVNVRASAAYMLGDALEQLGRYKDAYEQFNLAKNIYPNPDVIENRLAYLQKHYNIKKDSK